MRNPRRSATIAAVPAVRHTAPLVRLVLALGAVLSLLAGIQLFLLPGRTDDFFAWTIGTRSSAAFLGAFYWGSVAIAFTSFRRREWARARVGLYGLLAFFWVTLAATLAHLDRFHLGEGGTAARISAWAWLLVYVTIPPLTTAALALQWRIRGDDPAAGAPMPATQRLVIAAIGAALVVLAVVLFVAPGTAAEIWPWQLTPLTARASSAWVVGLGVILLTMAWDGDLERCVPAAAGIVGLPVLLAVALVRLRGDVSWTAGAAYVVVLAVLWLVAGIGVVLGARRQATAAGLRSPAAPAAPATPAS